MPTWANTLYSPNITNSQKIMINLSKLGQPDRFDWRRNLELIKKAVDVTKLNEDVYIIIKNIKYTGTTIGIDIIVNLSEQLNYFCTFILSDSLNLDSLYYIEKIDNLYPEDKLLLPASRQMNILGNQSGKSNHPIEQLEAVNAEADAPITMKQNEAPEEEDDDDDAELDQLFSFLKAQKETPVQIAQKAENNGLEWYSFFLNKDNSTEENDKNIANSLPENHLATCLSNIHIK